MQGLNMDFELTVPVMLRRAEQLFGPREIVTRLPDKSLHRYTYADFIPRARRLGAALTALGMERGDRVGTLAWNHYQHLEAYLGIPAFGGVTHTLNLRLHPTDLGYIAKHGGDKLLIVDESLLPLAQSFLGETDIEQVIVIGEAPDGMLSYEELIAGTDDPGEYPEIEELEAAAMCYTSGTTGHPKGALYSHRAIFLHTLVTTMSGALSISEADTVLPVVPMFHANAWGFPFSCTMVGAKQVFPGPHLDPPSLLELFQDERVTITGGVPTIWLGILQLLDSQPDAYDLSSVKSMVVGGAAAPRSLIEGLQERHGLSVLHAWGMTEMAPMGTTAQLPPDLLEASDDEQNAYRAKQGRPVPLVEIRARGEDGVVPWDGDDDGRAGGPRALDLELLLRRAGGGGSLDRRRLVQDRRRRHDRRARAASRSRTAPKDLVKSGGEWISSVALENALMGHPAVAEAAVIAVPDEQWSERPLAVVVFKEGESATARGAPRAPRGQLRQVPAAGALRVRRRDPEDGRRQVQEDGAAGAVRTRADPRLRVVEIAGKTFLVTGGASGLGAATARLLEEAGGHAVVADLPETDVTDEESVQWLLDSLDAVHGAVNCAGIGASARVVGKDDDGPFPLDLFRAVVDVNLTGTFNVIRLAATKMAQNEPDENGERGVIVNTASNAAFEGQVGQAAYSASKGGVVSMTLPIARELARYGIRVMAIAPGPADTPMLAQLPDADQRGARGADPVPAATRAPGGVRGARQRTSSRTRT